MKRIVFALVGVGVLAGAIAATAPVLGQADGEAAPIYGVKMPQGYRDWRLISVKRLTGKQLTGSGGNLKQLRAELGNNIAIKAYREGTLPFPDGSIIAALHWNEDSSDADNKALAEDPSDPGYQLEVYQARFQAAGAHISQGLKLRKDGKLAEALLQFERAYGIDPSSSVAEQEIRTTTQMIEREKKKGADSDTRGLTPSQLSKRNVEDKLGTRRFISPSGGLNP